MIYLDDFIFDAIEEVMSQDIPDELFPAALKARIFYQASVLAEDII